MSNRVLAIEVVAAVIRKAHGKNADRLKSHEQAIEVVNALSEEGLLKDG